MPVSAVTAPDAKSVTVCFTNTNGALKTKKGTSKVQGFTFGGQDERVSASAQIVSQNEVRVTVPEGADTTLIGYAFFTEVTEENADLTGGTGLPVPAFLIPTEK